MTPDDEIRKAIEWGKNQDSLRYPFDEFWFEKGFLAGQKSPQKCLWCPEHKDCIATNHLCNACLTALNQDCEKAQTQKILGEIDKWRKEHDLQFTELDRYINDRDLEELKSRLADLQGSDTLHSEVRK